jgi:hypothetical protein
MKKKFVWVFVGPTKTILAVYTKKDTVLQEIERLRLENLEYIETTLKKSVYWSRRVHKEPEIKHDHRTTDRISLLILGENQISFYVAVKKEIQ